MFLVVDIPQIRRCKTTLERCKRYGAQFECKILIFSRRIHIYEGIQGRNLYRRGIMRNWKWVLSGTIVANLWAHNGWRQISRRSSMIPRSIGLQVVPIKSIHFRALRKMWNEREKQISMISVIHCSNPKKISNLEIYNIWEGVSHKNDQGTY